MRSNQFPQLVRKTIDHIFLGTFYLQLVTMQKDWDAILADVSSESEDGDDLHAYHVVKNCRKTFDLLHAVLPQLDPSKSMTDPSDMQSVRNWFANTMRRMRSEPLNRVPPEKTVPSKQDASKSSRTGHES